MLGKKYLFGDKVEFSYLCIYMVNTDPVSGSINMVIFRK